jgi:uncharacterized protein (DUF2267 family)
MHHNSVDSLTYKAHMQTDRFIAQVYRACPQLEPDVVHQDTLIALDTLCEHLSAEQTRRMAAQLPDEIASAVTHGGKLADATGRPATLEDFYGTVMFRTELEEDDAQCLAHAVARTLATALSEGETEKVALDLPDALTPLLAD